MPTAELTTRRVLDMLAPFDDDVVPCTVLPDKWWLPTSGVYRKADGEYTDATAAAITLCLQCPQQVGCLDRQMRAEGTARPEKRYGVFGAMDPEDRYRLSRESGANSAIRTRPELGVEAAATRELILAARRVGETVTQLDTRIANAIGMQPESIAVIRTGRRKKVRTRTADAIREYLDIDGVETSAACGASPETQREGGQ